MTLWDEGFISNYEKASIGPTEVLNRGWDEMDGGLVNELRRKGCDRQLSWKIWVREGEQQ